MPTLTIAALTLRETVRRRVAAFVAGLSIVLVGLIAWGFWKLSDAIPERAGAIATDAAVLILIAFMFSVVLGIGAAFLASSSIASEIESGVALAVLPRPIARAEFVVGKWLGLVALVSIYSAVFGTLAMFAIALVAGYEPPHPAEALLYILGQSVALLTLALLFSTRLPALAGGVLSVALFGVSWIAGITAAIARALHSDALAHAASAVGLLLPMDGLWRGALFALTPVVLQVAQAARGGMGVNPFGATTPPPAAFLVWSLVWVGVVLGATVWSMQSRDL
jgi:ABC-type transport system involved in multi-copper enzyme maturation permease subunit